MNSKTMRKTYTAKAPCRVDLSGGTLDMWPIYLFFQDGILLNHMALDLYAETEIQFQKATQFSLKVESEDLRVSLNFKSLKEIKDSLKKDTTQNPLRWVLRVSAWCLQEWGLNKGNWIIKTKSQVPPGSGLGGSSTLGVSILTAWARAAQKEDDIKNNIWKYQGILRDLESVEIEMPAGEQDYVPALVGGLLTFKLSTGTKGVFKHPPKLAKNVSSQLGLIYTGKPHHSGINNWSVFKRYLEKDNKISTALESIQGVSEKMSRELFVKGSQKWKELVGEEWKHRQKLGPAVNAPVLREASNWILSQGVVATKACGAGGGGCLLVVFKDEKQKENLMKQKLPRKNWNWLPVKCAERGVLDAFK